MLYTLKNNELTVQISDEGAQIFSVLRGDCEYIWQADAKYWAGRTPLMFPICGRFFGTKYTHEGKEYSMGTHGFARHSTFSVLSANDTEIVLTLSENKYTLEQYPFSFRFTVTYKLEGNTVASTARIENTGDVMLPATFGAHPGFNVPLDKGEYEDWYIEFSEDCTPNVIVHSDTCFVTGQKRPFPLKDSRIIELRHSLFAIDSIFFDRIAPTATLKSKKSDRSVTLSYEGFPYLGIWHMPRTDAPYICIEPWCGLPSYDGVTDELTQKNDMFHILPKKDKTLSYQISFD